MRALLIFARKHISTSTGWLPVPAVAPVALYEPPPCGWDEDEEASIAAICETWLDDLCPKWAPTVFCAIWSISWKQNEKNDFIY
jgi:hypothetical protein